MFDALIPQIGLGFEVKSIGNGLYITREEAFSVTTPNSILLRVLSSTSVLVMIVSLSKLMMSQSYHFRPKDNLIFQIRNSFSEADDYYVKFKADNDQDGTGTYVEIAKPGIPNSFISDSMPHGIIRLAQTRKDADGDTIVTFLKLLHSSG